jgi:NCAIR mutase (PurE)-related protein
MEDIDYAHIDHHRSLRKGFPEVIFGEGKSAEQIIGIMKKMAVQELVILATRVSEQKSPSHSKTIFLCPLR